MMLDGREWNRMWTALGAQTVNGGLFNQLVRAYGEPQRHYHTLQHLRGCLAHWEAASALARRPEEIELALWFHDAVYDPRRSDNEARSAEWAQASVAAAGCTPEVARRIADLVLATASHLADVDDPDAQLLLDIDLAILGATAPRFAEYERQIRKEYAHVPEADFRTGRAQLLAGLLARPRLYATAPFHEALEARARENIGLSLARLQA